MHSQEAITCLIEEIKSCKEELQRRILKKNSKEELQKKNGKEEWQLVMEAAGQEHVSNFVEAN